MNKEEIMEIRKKLCVSQEKFAQLLGTTVVTVNRWENGHTSPSRLYVKELKELRDKHGSYACQCKEYEQPRRVCDVVNSGDGIAENA